MPKWIVGTQYRENYGDSEKPYWKMKGGSDYAVEAATAEEADEIVAAKKCYANEHAEEYIRCPAVPYEQFLEECRDHPWMVEAVETVA
jgi:ribulose bisphosphate carboxylase small subunit